MMRLRILRACKEHHLVAAGLCRYLLCIVKAFACISFAAVIFVRYDILDESVRTHAARKIRDYHADTGRYDLSVDLVEYKMMVRIVYDLLPGITKMLIIFGNTVLVKVQV